MANSIKQSGAGLALQITKPARATGLVEERPDGEARRLAEVFVHAVDGVLLVFDRERVDTAARAEVVASAAKDTDSIYRGSRASVQISGAGYKVQLPCATDAGLDEGDSAPTHTADGFIAITDGSKDANRLARDLVGIREEQLSTKC